MAYSEVVDVVRISGIFNQEVNEAIGTGDGNNAEFSLDNDRVVKDSETIYVDGVEKTRNTDYTIVNDSGKITFLSKPANGALITGKYKYLPESIDISNEDIEELILDADSEIDVWTGKKFTSGNTQTDYFEGREEKIVATGTVSNGSYFSESEEDRYNLILTKYPVQSITSFTFLKDDGTTDDTLVENTDFHLWTDTGLIKLITNVIPVGGGKKKVKVVYTYGYSEVPRAVKKLSSVLAGILTFVNLTGGSFDDITSYKLGPKEVGVGEPYMNMREALNRLEVERDRLLNQLGREVRTVVI